MLELAIRQIEFSREYTSLLLNDIAENEWFLQPAPSVTHLAWQVGHLAMAEYGLCLFRQRGRLPEDRALMPSTFRKKFSRGATPDFDPGNNPPVDEILDTFHRIHEQVRREAPGFSPEQLAEKIDEPYAVYDNKLGALLFCSHHEMIHAGQIGLLRRMLGKTAIR